LAANVEQCARLVALAEHLSAQGLRGIVDPDAVIRAARLAAMATKRLGLDRHTPSKPAASAFLDLLKAKR
jgi:hypothetical protein